MIQYLSAGTYRLAARAASGTPGGLYEVDVRSMLGSAACRSAALKATIPMGGSVSGTINFAGCQYTDATFADIYKIEVTGSATLDVRLDSSAFDAQLLLLDAKGNLVDGTTMAAGAQTRGSTAWWRRAHTTSWRTGQRLHFERRVHRVRTGGVTAHIVFLRFPGAPFSRGRMPARA